MTPADYARVKDVFAQAVRLPKRDRDSFLESECEGEPTIRDEVLSLLKHHNEETIISEVERTVVSEEVTSPSKVDPYLVLSDVWEEYRQIVRRRLVIIATVMAGLIAVSMLRLATYHTAHWGYGTRVAAIIVSLCVAAALRERRDFGIGWLRAAELVVMANVGLLVLVIYVRTMLDVAAKHDDATLISINDWHFIAWTIVIFVYGVFMPNDWKRAASVLFPVAAIPMLSTWLVCLKYPEIAEMLRRSEFGQPIPTPFVAAAIATYAAHTIHGARVSAYTARRLAQYELVRLIGEGGMGEVHEAEHVLLKRTCAIKLIRRHRIADDRALKRFQREVRATAKLTHPHTIEVYDYGKASGDVFFFAMELLPGMNLRDLVRTAGPLPPPRAIHFLIDVSDALIEAHVANLIHRDIKPANIFASQRGGIYDYTKLLDFGIVREIRVDPNFSLTASLVAGTPAYMSPEQATEPEKIDPRSDLYSVGAVGYFLLSGRAPFQGHSPMEVMLAQVNQDPDPLSMHCPGVPKDLEAVLMQCLSRDPNQRPADARALRDALQRCQCAGQWSRMDATQWWLQHPSPQLAPADSEGETRAGEKTIESLAGGPVRPTE